MHCSMLSIFTRSLTRCWGSLLASGTTKDISSDMADCPSPGTTVALLAENHCYIQEEEDPESPLGSSGFAKKEISAKSDLEPMNNMALEAFSLPMTAGSTGSRIMVESWVLGSDLDYKLDSLSCEHSCLPLVH